MGYAIKSPVNRNGFTFVCSAFSSPRPSSLLLVYCLRRQARKRYKCCPWGAHLLLPVFVVLLFFSSPPSFPLFSAFSSSLSLPPFDACFFPSERFRATSSPAGSTCTLGFDDLLLFLGFAKTPRVYTLQFLTERTNAMTCGWRTWNCVFCFSEPEGKNPIISTYFFRSTNYVTINSLNFIIYIF